MANKEMTKKELMNKARELCREEFGHVQVCKDSEILEEAYKRNRAKWSAMMVFCAELFDMDLCEWVKYNPDSE